MNAGFDWLRDDTERGIPASLTDTVRLLDYVAAMEAALLPTLDSVHPLEYGFRDGHAVTGYEPDDATVVDRMARCFSCEEWSPCDVRKIVSGPRGDTPK